MYDIFVICYVRVVLHVHSKAIVRCVVVVVVVVVSFLHMFQCYSLI